MLPKLLFSLTCVLLPVAWGILVNWLFDLWSQRRVRRKESDSVFPDYQI